MNPEPIMDLAHLGHLEMLTPKPEESLAFFINVLGMTESGREGDSVYLRGWDDYERHTLKLTASKLPGMGHVAFRARSPQALERRVAALKGSGFDIGCNRTFFENYLGFRLTEQIVLDDGSEAAMWMTCTNKSYDFAYTRDHTGTKGRFHHVTYAVDSREDVLRAADIFLENGVYIETGPHKHAIQQTFFLYVYEPGGNRVEVANAGARLILAPDWKPIVWTEEERKKGQAWGLKTIESFHTHGTPPV